MNRNAPFTRADLDELGAFYATSAGVVAMREVLAGNRDAKVIAVRHDVDNHPDALATAVELARWEAENGWRSTYFLLHTAKYWLDGRWRAAADTIAGLDHEIGLHVDAVAYTLEHGGDPHNMVAAALSEMRAAGHSVVGVVGHGNPLCREAEFANDEQFVECARPGLGAPDRVLRYGQRTLRLDPRPLADFGLKYESISLRQMQGRDGVWRTRRGQVYNTDSGGRWYYPFEDTVVAFRAIRDGQLHLLQHPDWWSEAFALEKAAA